MNTNLSVSNIGWKTECNAQIYDYLRDLNICGLDIAPTLIGEINSIDVKKVIKEVTEAKLKIIGMQSLLFSCPPVSIFDGNKEKTIIFKKLDKCFSLANKLGVSILVFGSPKNRFIKNTANFNYNNAVAIFKEMSDIAKKYNCIVCFEPNPRQYGCNFMVNTYDALDFVKKVNHANFKINLDISTTIINNESVAAIFDKGFDLIEHIHISAPGLKTIATINNREIAATIKKFHYNKWIALECNYQEEQTLDKIKADIELFKEVYQ